MNKVKVKIKKLNHFDNEHLLPFYASDGAAGADIRAMLGKGNELLLKPGERVLIPTGLSVEIPVGYEIQVRPRSGLSYKTSLMVLNSPGTIDSDYRGEVKIIMGNLGTSDQIIVHGERVAQFVLAPVVFADFEEATDLTDTIRGSGGLGSTGTK